ncbi:MAG: LysE family transporter [Chloroflexi bacterium]|nr:LysE family transporter [Chloroflexota bacterium]
MVLVLKGFIIGVVVAVPLGPVGLLCFQRLLHEGPQAGLLSGLGAAAADALYACIAGCGLAAFSDFILGQQTVLRLAGGAFLLYLGVRSWQRPFALPSRTFDSEWTQATQGSHRPSRAFLSTFLFTLTNPMLLLIFWALFALLQIPHGWRAIWAVLGVALGSASWWFFLAPLTARWRERLTWRQLHQIQRLAAGLLALFGLWLLFEALAHTFGWSMLHH